MITAKIVTMPCGLSAPAGHVASQHMRECSRCKQVQIDWRAKAWWTFVRTGAGLRPRGFVAKLRTGWA